MRIEECEDISDIFSIFHDGGIVAAYHQDESFVLEIEIQYLSQRVNPEYNGFKVSLYGFSNAVFTTWPKDSKSNPKKITNVKSIFKSELEILQANLDDNKIEVLCELLSSEYDYYGGKLSFTVNSAEVQDDSGKVYSIEELGVLCKSYWDEWAANNK
ncbi:hypothetical protein [Kiloniella majae]|uniref:hypothetical protein n=1 Tax=Kiloniella majae TaxID=1938558 RepID=UPI000A2794E0|nr:hypothetical protein [Kiloniella majae]